MIGLIEGFETLPRASITLSTTSASGPAKQETLEGIPLLSALVAKPRVMLRIAAQDGSMLALSARDAEDAFLVPIEGGWQIALPKDKTRKRFIKHPVEFMAE